MTVTLAEDIALLSLDDESGAAKERQSAGWAVAGGILLELAMAGRVTVADGRLEVTDTTPTGTALLDGRLERLEEWTRRKSRRKVADWLTKDQSKAVAATVESLCARGLVTEERGKVLGLFPVRRYPEADGSVERELRARLTSVVVHGMEPDDRTSGLVALLHAAKLYRLAFPDVPRKLVAPRMAKIADGQWAGDGVREAIRNMQAAMVAVTVATTVTVL
ncbi:GPP34 family phosphoprotein [Streptomyces sp. WAC05374]|uniref:GOLPH3/VPS74 family protein n=1 Tax=Streptomyces sp. WAC05374 TaxID=2487420 RepID=UPI000F87C8E3|nr:GPP34 family phosphoprotein [Streptomyces sp. WAC05374]RST11664.1 GPP34 family phosphoprotein [Streptomyces sp. WAC05374]TDF47163.1 GPP34 family phosphoprotein [Streptomyces sp. WAC05374]TDF57421.1 GPP34 family phosphoprotein [Streptomyces sp. WAC05374]TDF61526.1 GPP34 family phosphoprotein [Streptomyces sp. WAC05374]